MRPVGTRIKRCPVDPASLVADRDAFARIVDDLRQHGGPWTPISRWITTDPDTPVREGRPADMDEAFSAQEFNERFSSMDRMLMAWIGSGQMRGIDDRYLADYGRVLADGDVLGLWRDNIADETVRRGLITGDLGTIMDLSLVYAFAGGPRPGRTMVLEVGGGYGRLAEGALNVFGTSVCYVLVDAVPGSLYYAAAYLRRAVPEARIGSYYDGDPFDLDRFDAYVVPTWHFVRANTSSYDVLVNIESLQEMSQELVDSYLALLDGCAHTGSLLYLSNARDHLFRGAWSFPASWKPLLCANTPRSWTRDHPTQIFEKSDAPRQGAARLAEALYRRTLRDEDDLGDVVANVGLRRLAPAVARLALSAALRRAARVIGRE